MTQYAVLTGSGNGLFTAFHAGFISINKNGIFRLHYKIKLLIELKIVDHFEGVFFMGITIMKT